MDNSVAILENMIKSKEYKNLSKCAKQCDNFSKILDKEIAIIKKIKELSETKNNEKALDSIIIKAGEITKLTKEMAQVYTKKDALLCAMNKCANDMVDVQIKKNHLAIESLEKTEKLFDNARKKMAKKNKIAQ
uniref:Uncharacterized protein n=1 Tax=viral metagenome TaxID=1070528 RepID=A0A6C0CTY8_9ZZZZ